MIQIEKYKNAFGFDFSITRPKCGLQRRFKAEKYKVELNFISNGDEQKDVLLNLHNIHSVNDKVN